MTTAIQTRVKIFEDPPIYLVDTPGIFDPRVSSPLEGLKISLTGCTKDKFTEVVCVADYLLFRLNNSKNRKSYCEYFNIEPTDEIYQLLGHICESRDFRILFRSRLNKVLNSSTEIVKGNGLSKENRPYDLDRAARYLLDEYREGRFGGMTLDDCSPLGLKEWFDKHPSTHNYKLA